MVQLGLVDDFKRQFHQWCHTALPIKDPNSVLGQQNLTGCEMHEVVIQTVEPLPTR